jgi:hypothetical protein
MMLRLLLLLIPTAGFLIHGELVMATGTRDLKLTAVLNLESKLMAVLAETLDFSKFLCFNFSDLCLVVYHFKIER